MKSEVKSVKGRFGRLMSKGLILWLSWAWGLGVVAEGGDYAIERHRIAWSGSMPAKTHEGLISPQSYEIAISDKGEVEKLEVVLDMRSIDVTDLEGKGRAKLTKHLMSEDFFYVERYPTAWFRLERYADGQLHGQIEIRGIRKGIVIPVEVEGSPEEGFRLTGRFSFNRQDFEVNYQNSGLFGVAKDKLIRDEVKLDIELLLKQI